MKPLENKSSKLKMEEMEKKLQGQSINELAQSKDIDKSIMKECIGEDKMEKKREMQYVYGEEESGTSRRDTWAMESIRRRRSSRSVSLSKPTNIFGRSTSIFSDNSDIFETPRVSRSSSLDSLTSPGETEKKACSNCQLLSRKVEEQRMAYLRQLKFRKNERDRMYVEYETRHKEMAAKLAHLDTKLHHVTEQMNMKEISARVTVQISEHEKMKEIRKLTKEKEKAEREKEWAKKELDRAEKELEQAERERDEAEKKIDEERLLRLEMELLYISCEPKSV